MIAIAMANNPDVLIADEPTTALDVTIQAQVLEAAADALRGRRMPLVLITHDLGVVAGIADRVLVMYAGRAVESGRVDDIFADPRIPYTLGAARLAAAARRAERERLTPSRARRRRCRPAAGLPVRAALPAGARACDARNRPLPGGAEHRPTHRRRPATSPSGRRAERGRAVSLAIAATMPAEVVAA